MSRSHPTRELATVLFTDVVDSTRQVADSGDQVWARVLDALDGVTRSATRNHGGEVVKNTGDGALLLLPSPTAAITCATALHHGAAVLGVALRIGAHTGEVERRGLDVAGLAVHVAARLMGAAGAGETVVSATVHDLATVEDVRYADRGALDLKGVPGTTRAYLVLASEVTTQQRSVGLPGSGTDAVVRLLQQLRYEEADELARSNDDPCGLVDALVAARGRVEYLDVDVTLVRMLRDVLDLLPPDDNERRSRVAAKIAFELRGDPASRSERIDLLVQAQRDAERAGDDHALCEVMLATLHTLWEPDGAETRLAAADRVIALTRHTHDLDHEGEARLARLHALLEVWRFREAELELASYARLAERIDSAHLDTFVASRRSMFAQITGRYDEALTYGEAAYRSAVAAGMLDAERVRAALLGLVELDRVVDPDLLPAGLEHMQQLGARTPGNYYEADVARMLVLLGRHEEARAELARAMPSLLTSSGARWLYAASWAAEAAVAVGTDNQCQRLYEALRPHRDRPIFVGPMFYGAVAEKLGRLALRLGRPDEAVELLGQAVEVLDGVVALPWATRSRIGLADALRAAGDDVSAERELAAGMASARGLGMTRYLADLGQEPEVGTTWELRADGDGWVLDTGQERARLRASRGVEQLCVLLANPQQDISAHRLEAGDDAPHAQAGLPVIDDEAARAYRRRLEEIGEEQESADRSGDAAASARLEDERAHLLAELRGATGLAGRRRTTGGSAERARVNVTRNLKRVIDQVQRAAPLAGAHLAASVRTGSRCRYEPAAGGPTAWVIRAGAEVR